MLHLFGLYTISVDSFHMWFNNTPTAALGAGEIRKWNSTNKGGHCEGGSTALARGLMRRQMPGKYKFLLTYLKKKN